MRTLLIVLVALAGLAGPAWADARSEFDAGAAAYYAGNAAYYLGALDTAIADYTKAVELEPGYAKAYSARGGAYFRKRLYDQAIADPAVQHSELPPCDLARVRF